MMVKRSRLSRNIKLVIQKPRGRLKFESYDRLDDYMHRIGAAHILDDIVDMEMRSSKSAGMRANRQEMQDRVLMWWNTKTDEPDAISHRPSYIMTFMLRKAAKKRSV